MGQRQKIKLIIIVLVFCVGSILLPIPLFAASSYVLPYPSAMPGSKTYLLHKFEEKLLSVWYFGDFGRLTFQREMSDKYLVEAKTLFEYKQYLLGMKALERSNSYFEDEIALMKHVNNHKNGFLEEKNLIVEQARKHVEILSNLQNILPNNFFWQDEKAVPKTLQIHAELSLSISQRKNFL